MKRLRLPETHNTRCYMLFYCDIFSSPHALVGRTNVASRDTAAVVLTTPVQNNWYLYIVYTYKTQNVHVLYIVCIGITFAHESRASKRILFLCTTFSFSFFYYGSNTSAAGQRDPGSIRD